MNERLADLVRRLRAEARRADHRRLLVVAGEDRVVDRALGQVVDAADPDPTAVTLVGERDLLECERLAPFRAGELLGTTREMVVVDGRDRLDPNALGRSVGAVDGGGLLVLLAPPLGAWPDRTDGFDETLAVPPHDPDAVGGRFRRRLVRTLLEHPGVAVVEVAGGEDPDPIDVTVRRDGLVDPAPRLDADAPGPPADATFPAAAYRACLTADQADALAALEALAHDADDAGGGSDVIDGDDGDGDDHGDGDSRDEDGDPRDGADDRRDGSSDPPGDPDPRAVVVEADRGRGKSSAAGLAAGALAARGESVVVTAPEFRNARAVFARASELLADLDPADGESSQGDDPPPGSDRGDDGDGETDPPRRIDVPGGGSVAYRPPGAIAGGDADTNADRGAGAVADPDPGGNGQAETGAEADVLVVDEAAALPVDRLVETLAVDRVAYATTVHGYEGTGRGFAVRFLPRLGDDRPVDRVGLAEPVRYAPDDPVETWAFRALGLDARPAVDPVVSGATPETVDYRALDPDELVADDRLLREAFGLLVLAHYRTEPADLARLLDAPNVTVRALLFEGHVVSVALLAREGGLSPTWRRRIYEGERIRGQMLPDVLTSQLRDEAAGRPEGLRVMRIATHHAVRSRGLGSHLLERVREEFGEEVDWLGTGFGATPRLVRFWARNGYRAVHLSVTRNDRSGEHSVLMLSPTGAAGRDLTERHARRFADRAVGALSDPLARVDPDVVRAVLAATGVSRPPDLDEWGWRTVAGAAYGPGLYEVDPGPVRELVLAGLLEAGTDRETAAGSDRGDEDDEGDSGGPGGDSDGSDREGGPTDGPHAAGESPTASATLTDRQERLLVATILQGRPASAVAEDLGYHSTGQCLRAVGDALAVLVDRYGGPVAREERRRYD